MFGPLGQDGEGGAPAGQPGAAEAVAENAQAAGADAEEIDDDEADLPVAAEKPGKACIAGHPGAVTSNQTLLQWLPKCDTVAALWEATAEQKIQARMDDNDALVRVAYQCRTDVTWGGETLALAGRTLEEAFALENLEWCQDKNRKPLQLRIAKAEEKNLTTLAERIHKRVQAKSFSKTDFALALLAEDPSSWLVPTYIAEGLSWLETEIAPPEPDEDQPHEDAPQGAPAAVGDQVAA
ncbi:hypothetical protein D9M70_369570 [compost metagenome]